MLEMKKYKKRIITSGFIVLGILLLNLAISLTTGFNVLSNTLNFVSNKMSPNTQEVESIGLTSDGYNDNEGGSYDIKKSAKWTGTDKAQIKFDVETSIKKNNLHKDVILVLDISGSMDGEKLDRVKRMLKI